MKKKEISSKSEQSAKSGSVSYGDNASDNITITGSVGGDVVVGDKNQTQSERSVIVKTNSGTIKTSDEVHHHYHQPSLSQDPEKKDPQNPDDDAAVRVAKLTRGGTIRAALITALGVVLVATIGLVGKFGDRKRKPEGNKFTIKVLDKTTSRGIGGAKVSLEASGISAVNTTDSEGIISFPITDPRKEYRLRVEVVGYEPGFNLRVTPADIEGTQEVRLSPIVAPVPGPPALAPSPSAPQTSHSQGSNAARPGNKQLVIRGQVFDEAGAAVPGALVIIGGQGSTVTDSSGNFQIPVPIILGRLVKLNISKEGFMTKSMEEQASEDALEIKLLKPKRLQ